MTSGALLTDFLFIRPHLKLVVLIQSGRGLDLTVLPVAGLCDAFKRFAINLCVRIDEEIDGPTFLGRAQSQITTGAQSDAVCGL